MWLRRDFVLGALTVFNFLLAGYLTFLYFHPTPRGMIKPTADIGLEAPVLTPSQQRMYTRHPSSASSTRTIVLSVAPEFGAEQRNAVLEAAAEWNFVLNGYVQFVVEIANGPPYKPGREGWGLLRLAGGVALNRSGTEQVAMTLTAEQGGVILIYTDRLYQIELRRVVLHELGHVLGLGHNERSRLMSSRYFGDYQKCVDYVTAQMVSATLRIPMQELNWCGQPPSGNQF